MHKRFFSVVIIGLLLNYVCYPSGAASSTPKEVELAAKVKAAITKLGTGPEARVAVKLRDKSKLKGYVNDISDNHFVVIDDMTGAATTVPYPQVKKVKGNNLSSGAKIAIGVGIVIGVIILLVIGNLNSDG
jgi:small nuclear ribonucleoprotein (snRNP)-like protein